MSVRLSRPCAHPARRGCLGVLAGILLAGFLPAGVVRASEPGSVFPLLEAMRQAIGNTTYRGVLVHVHARDLDVIEILHRGGTREYERLYSLTGEPREVIRTPQGVTCILPRQHAIMVDHSLPEGPAGRQGIPFDAERLRAVYRFRRQGEDRVAGHRTLVVSIEPRDDYRYGHRFWVETRTHLPLRSELFTRDGRVLARLLYASIEFPGEIPDAALEPHLRGEGYRTFRTREPRGRETGGDNAPVTGPGSGVRVGWIPPGFLMRAHRWHGMPLSETAVEHLLYSDGLASFSVYVEPAGGEGRTHRLDGTVVMGAIHAAGRQMDGVHVTVVGEVPEITVRKVIANIEPERRP